MGAVGFAAANASPVPLLPAVSRDPLAQPVPGDPSPAASSTHVDPFIGKKVGNFELIRRVGSGGMGAVYEGVHPIVGIRVAVKVLGGQLALDRDLVERFFAEARTLNQVAHDNIVRAIDLGQHRGGFYYCVMELLEGETLAAVLGRGRVDLQRSLSLLIQACDALAAAHDKGIVHRDLKPANIMLVRNPSSGAEQVKLVDFGIAKLRTAVNSGHATVTGTVIGTPAYMSPEQASGRVNEVDHRSDLYSLGIVAYELLTGRHPFAGRAAGELIVAQLTETPAPPSTHGPVPRTLEELVIRLLSKRREDRPASADAVAHALRGVQELLTSPPLPASLLDPSTSLVSKPPGAVASLSPAPDSPGFGGLQSEPTPPPWPESSVAAEPLPRLRNPAVESNPSSIVGSASRSDAAREPTVGHLPPTSEATIPLGSRGKQRETNARVHLANRHRKKGLAARPSFWITLLLAGIALGGALVGAFDADSFAATVAEAFGRPRQVARPPRPAAPAPDGVSAAFLALPDIEVCKPLLDQSRVLGQVGPEGTSLKDTLFQRHERFRALLECIEPHRRSEERWAAHYVEGIAAFEFGLQLDRLPPDARARARSMTHPQFGAAFQAEQYASLAVTRFGDARTLAPEAQQGFIERYLVEASALELRARQQGASVAPAKTPAR